MCRENCHHGYIRTITHHHTIISVQSSPYNHLHKMCHLMCHLMCMKNCHHGYIPESIHHHTIISVRSISTSCAIWCAEIFVNMITYVRSHTTIQCSSYGVATMSRILKNIGLFCKRDLQKRPIFCKETYIFKHPTHRSHPIGSSPHAVPSDVQR